MAAVLTGTIRITVPSPHGRELLRAILEAGALFGEIALLEGKERTAGTAAARTVKGRMAPAVDVADLVPLARPYNDGVFQNHNDKIAAVKLPGINRSCRRSPLHLASCRPRRSEQMGQDEKDGIDRCGAFECVIWARTTLS
jgi:hypothetical protein